MSIVRSGLIMKRWYCFRHIIHIKWAFTICLLSKWCQFELSNDEEITISFNFMILPFNFHEMLFFANSRVTMSFRCCRAPRMYKWISFLIFQGEAGMSSILKAHPSKSTYILMPLNESFIMSRQLSPKSQQIETRKAAM